MYIVTLADIVLLPDNNYMIRIENEQNYFVNSWNQIGILPNVDNDIISKKEYLELVKKATTYDLADPLTRTRVTTNGEHYFKDYMSENCLVILDETYFIELGGTGQFKVQIDERNPRDIVPLPRFYVEDLIAEKLYVGDKKSCDINKILKTNDDDIWSRSKKMAEDTRIEAAKICIDPDFITPESSEYVPNIPRPRLLHEYTLSMDIMKLTAICHIILSHFINKYLQKLKEKLYNFTNDYFNLSLDKYYLAVEP